jgi:hypothetical protein
MASPGVLGYSKLTMPTPSRAASSGVDQLGTTVANTTDGKLSTAWQTGGGGGGSAIADYAFPGASYPATDLAYGAIVAVMGVDQSNTTGYTSTITVTVSVGSGVGATDVYTGTRTVTRYASTPSANAYFLISGYDADPNVTTARLKGGTLLSGKYLRVSITWTGTGFGTIGEVMVFRGFFANVEANRRYVATDSSVVQRAYSNTPYVNQKTPGRSLEGVFNNLNDEAVFGGTSSGLSKLNTLTDVALRAGVSGDVIFMPTATPYTGVREPAWQVACMYGKLDAPLRAEERSLVGGGGNSQWSAPFRIIETVS